MPVFGNRGIARGRGKNLRWIIAAVIAVGAIIGFYSKTSVNPVTGEKQRVALSPDQEKALGLEAAPQMARQMGGAVDPRRDRDAALVAEVGAKIVRLSDAGRSNYADNFNFQLLDDTQTVNAFALPGGQIFITRALFDRLETEGQLAGVLGHEAGHVVGRHSAEQMAKGQLGQMLVTAVAVGASGEERGQFAMVAAQMANQMTQLHYGRDDEVQADTLGLKYMAQAGYHPRGMLGVMKVLADASKGSRQPEFLASHPHPESRLETIDKYLKDNKAQLDQANLSDGQPLR